MAFVETSAEQDIPVTVMLGGTLFNSDNCWLEQVFDILIVTLRYLEELFEGFGGCLMNLNLRMKTPCVLHEKFLGQPQAIRIYYKIAHKFLWALYGRLEGIDIERNEGI